MVWQFGPGILMHFPFSQMVPTLHKTAAQLSTWSLTQPVPLTQVEPAEHLISLQSGPGILIHFPFSQMVPTMQETAAQLST